MSPVWAAVLVAGYALLFRAMGSAARRLEVAERRERRVEQAKLELFAFHAEVERERAVWAEVCELERLFLEDEQ